MSKCHILLTGSPGVGKTTLVKSIVASLISNDDVPVVGFYTEELRQDGQRIGFDVVSLVDNSRRPLARVHQSSDAGTSDRPRVGKYVVDVNTFEEASLGALDAVIGEPQRSTLVVIDEVGKMEMFSKRFADVVSRAFVQPSSLVLATVPAKSASIPLVQQLIARQDTRLYEVTRDNRRWLHDEIVTEIHRSVDILLKR